MVAVFIIYWVLPHKFRWVALLAANVIFYASYEARFLLLILLLTLVSYFCAILMEKYANRKKLILVISVVFTLLFLVYYKYTGFAFGTGIDRLAMMKFGITDIRYMYTNDVRFLKEFSKEGE